MSCPYSDEELQKWDSVTNPMGDACYTCQDCHCEHWAGTCSDDCARIYTDFCVEGGGPHFPPDPYEEDDLP
jgi:hypothetical protein